MGGVAALWTLMTALSASMNATTAPAAWELDHTLPALAAPGTVFRTPVPNAAAVATHTAQTPPPILAALAWAEAAWLPIALLALAVALLVRLSAHRRRGQRVAEGRLQALVGSLPGTVYVLRRRKGGGYRFEFISPNAIDVLGIDAQAVMADARATRAVVLREDRPVIDEALARSARDLGLLEADFRVRRPGGGIAWLRSSATPALQPGGEVVWTGYWSDITAVKATEQDLRDASARLEAAHALAGLGDWICDLATGEQSWSPGVFRLLQRDPAQGAPTLKEMAALFDDGARLLADAFYAAQETGQRQAVELTAPVADGETTTLELIVLPAADAAGNVIGMQGTLQDITARKRLEARLARARDDADGASRAKTMFLATMSHEIRTHLNGMLGVLDVVFRTPLEPDLRGALEGVRESGKSLQQIIDDILDFSKVEAGKLEIRNEPASVAELVAGVRRIHAGSASSAGVELRHRVDRGVAPAVLVDALRLRQILGNFVSNAIKFTPQGHVEIRVSSLRRSGQRQRLLFEVEDTGVGIAPERQARLFQPFEQAETGAASRPGGTGLGLSISRRLAGLMGGTVGLRSTPGVGTVMWLELEVLTTDPARVRAAAPPVQVAASASPPRVGTLKVPDAGPAALRPDRVLVVDDHPVNRMVMRSQLNALGYAVEEADGGVAALAAWRRLRPALILTDCNMPQMSGYDLSRAIRTAEAEQGLARLPIVACSANVISGVQQECLDSGMDDYIPKPTELALLAEVMCRWLGPVAADAPPTASRGAVSAADDALREPAESAARPRAADANTQGVLHPASLDDPDARRRVFSRFRRSNESDAASLADAVAGGDLPAVTRLAHRMKGACAFMGANALGTACARLEEAARAGDAAALAPMMEGFRSELERVNGQLEAR